MFGLGSGRWRIAPVLAAALAAGGAGRGEAANERPIALVCTLSGGAKSGAGLTDEAVCARFAREFAATLGAPVNQVETVPEASRGRWIRVRIRILPRDRIAAELTSQLHNGTKVHPPIAVQVMDKPLDLREVDRLARLAAQQLARSGGQQPAKAPT